MKWVVDVLFVVRPRLQAADGHCFGAWRLCLRVRASLRLSCPYEFVTKMVWFTLHKTKKYFQTVLLPHYYIFYLERSKVNSKVKVNDAKIVKTPISFSVRNSTADIPICFEQRPKRCTILGGPFIAPLHFGQGQCQRSRCHKWGGQICPDPTLWYFIFFPSA